MQRFLVLLLYSTVIISFLALPPGNVHAQDEIPRSPEEWIGKMVGDKKCLVTRAAVPRIAKESPKQLWKEYQEADHDRKLAWDLFLGGVLWPIRSENDFLDRIAHVKQETCSLMPQLGVPSASIRVDIEMPTHSKSDLPFPPKTGVGKDKPPDGPPDKPTVSGVPPFDNFKIKIIKTSPEGLTVRVSPQKEASAKAPGPTAKKSVLIAHLEAGQHSQAAARMARDPATAREELQADWDERIDSITRALRDRRYAVALHEIEVAMRVHGNHHRLWSLRCQAEMGRGRPELARDIRNRNPLFVTPVVGNRGELLFGNQGELLLQSGQERLPLNHERFEDWPVVVDVSRLSENDFEQVARRLGQQQQANPRFEFTLKLTRDGETRLARLRDWEHLRLIADPPRLQTLPSDVRDAMIAWLQRIATDAPEGQNNPGIRLIVAHHDRGGNLIEQITAQGQEGGLRNQHLILIVCNPARFAEFRAISLRALGEGEASSVLFPGEVVQARSGPLVVDRLFQIIRQGTRQHPSMSAAELFNQAREDILRRLEQCSQEADPKAALRREFEGFHGDPVDLFRSNGGLFRSSNRRAFDPGLLRDAIRQLRNLRLIQVVLRPQPRPDIG